MQVIKGRTAFEAKKRFGILWTIWQGGFSDDYLPGEGKFMSFREYLRMNPVKARLVQQPEDYPYNSAHIGFELDAAPFLSRAEARFVS